MDTQAIFGLQFLLSLIAWGVVVGLLPSRWLAQKPRHEALLWLSLPHVFRHIGMVFLVPGVVDQTLPAGFSIPAAYGDLATGLLALGAILALHSKWSLAIPLVWTFNVVGTVDLANALRHLDVAPLFGAAWYIPTMLVPLLLVTHFLMFKRLLGR
ncbi:MAG: hypothetical protein V3T86_17995 [Planctomycetota bacterium]